jgi:hypothetical protein
MAVIWRLIAKACRSSLRAGSQKRVMRRISAYVLMCWKLSNRFCCEKGASLRLRAFFINGAAVDPGSVGIRDRAVAVRVVSAAVVESVRESVVDR